MQKNQIKAHSHGIVSKGVPGKRVVTMEEFCVGFFKITSISWTNKQFPTFHLVLVICGAEWLSFSSSWKNSSTCMCDMNCIWHKKKSQNWTLFTVFISLEVCSSGIASTTRNTLSSTAGDWLISERNWRRDIFYLFHLLNEKKL